MSKTEIFAADFETTTDPEKRKCGHGVLVI